MTKRKIVIASVLKPVDDSRMTEKIGMSLHSTGRFEVHVIGQPGATEAFSGPSFHPLPRFGRLSVNRLVARLAVLRRVLRIKPSALVVTTHELLATALIAKIVTGVRIVYDVQENYYRNIRFTDAYHPAIRVVLAAWVRLKEVMISHAVSHFLLAEKAYADEFSFHRGRYTIVENKVLRPTGMLTQRGQPLTKLLFTGTMAESTGVFTAIEIAIKLHSRDKNFTLLLIGYCPRRDVLEKIRGTIEPYPFIQLIAGDQPAPHRQILQAIRDADLGVIAYPDNPSTRNLMPTKLYEYLGYRLPILLVNNRTWEAFCKASNGAFAFDPKRFHPSEVLNAIRQKAFYTTAPEDIYWETEELKLVNCLDELVR